MSISRNGSRPTEKAPAEHFTCSVRVEYLWMEKVTDEQYRARSEKAAASGERKAP